MEREDYQQLLDKHDWYYEFSDDPRVYKKGKQERRKLVSLAKSSEELASLYSQEHKKHFGGRYEG